MDVGCSIYSLIACFSWSNLYIDAGLSWQDRGEIQVTQFGTFDPNLLDGVHDSRPYVFTDDEPSNPYADIGIGYAVNFHSVEVSLALRAHKSSISTGADRGFNYARVGFKWYPFKR